MAPLDDADPPGPDSNRDAFQMAERPHEPRSFALAYDDATPPETDYETEAQANDGPPAGHGGDGAGAPDRGAE